MDNCLQFESRLLKADSQLLPSDSEGILKSGMAGVG